MIDFIIAKFRYQTTRIFFLVTGLALFFLAHRFCVMNLQGEFLSAGGTLNLVGENSAWWFTQIFFLALLFLLIALILLILIFIIDHVKSRQEAVAESHKIQLTDIVLRYIFRDLIQDKNAFEANWGSLKKKLKNKKFCETFFFIIVRVQEMIDEDLSMIFSELIRKTGLEGEISNFLYSRKLSRRIIALSLIQYLKLSGYERPLMLYINSSNHTLRIRALVALVNLIPLKQSDFIISIRRFVSKLDINVIVNEVERIHCCDFDYSDFLRSANNRIIIIGLLLIKRNKKYEYKELVKQTIDTADGFLREIAWEVFTFLATTEEDLGFMTERFWSETINSKSLILVAVKSFEVTERLIAFIRDVLKNECLLLKIEALKYLFDKNPEIFLLYQGSEDEIIQKAYNELLDFNLS